MLARAYECAAVLDEKIAVWRHDVLSDEPQLLVHELGISLEELTIDHMIQTSVRSRVTHPRIF